LIRCLVIASTLAVAASLLLATGAAAAPPGSRYSSQYIRSADGTPLFTQVFRPTSVPPDAKTPVILIVGPYFGDDAYEPNGYMTSPYYDSLFDAALRRGYTLVQVTLRGFGGSGGCSDLSGPGEQSDVVAAVQWAASQPWSSGRVGMYGLSTDAVSEIMALASKPRGLAATVIAAGGVSAYRVFFMNGNRYTPFAQTLEPYYQLYVLPPPGALSDPAGAQALVARLSDPACLAAREQAEQSSDPTAQFWRERDWLPAASGSTVPVLYSQGFLDANVKPDNFMALWPELRGPKRAWLGQYPHLIPGEVQAVSGLPDPVGRNSFVDETMRWFDRYVKGLGESAAPVEHDPPVEVEEGSSGSWRSEPEWPPADAAPDGLPLLPGTYLDEPGNKGEPYCERTDPQCPPGPTGNGSWTISQPLPYDVWLSGAPELDVTLRASPPQVNLVAFLYDIAPDGRAALITRGATVARPGAALSFHLYPQDWRVGAGHRIGILLSGADDGWFTAGTTGAQVGVASGVLKTPFLRYQRTARLPGGPSQDVQQRATFAVGPTVIRARTRVEPLPPRLAGTPRPTTGPAACGATPRLRLEVRPRRVRAMRRVRFRFKVTARCGRKVEPVPGATIRFAGTRVRTGRHGRADVARRLRRTGRFRAVVRKRGFRPGARAVTAAR
jgi:predicted acyl esterase